MINSKLGGRYNTKLGGRYNTKLGGRNNTKLGGRYNTQVYFWGLPKGFTNKTLKPYIASFLYLSYHTKGKLQL